MTSGRATYELVEGILETPELRVFRGRGPDGRPVVVRVVGEGDPRYRSSGELPVELERQARTSHPGLVGLLAHGAFRDGPPEWLGAVDIDRGNWFVHPFSTGGIVGRGVVPASWAALESILVQILGTLSHLHARQWTHGALSEGRVLYFPDRVPWIQLDAFRGLGRADPEAPESPPEIRDSRRAAPGPWSDLYSVGRLAEGLAERRPSGESSDGGELVELPEDFDGWVERMVAENPWQRPRSAAEAIEELADLGATRRRGGEVSLRVVEDGGTREVVEPRVPTDALARVGAPVRAADRREEPVDTGDAVVVRGELERGWTQRRRRRATGGGAAARRPPPIGRDAALRRLGEAFGRVAEEGASEMVLIEGPLGVGASFLAGWFGRTVREMGWARFSCTVHSASGGPHEGLEGLFRRIFVGETAGFGRGTPSIGNRIRTRANRRGSVDPEVLDLDIRAALHLVGRQPPESSYRFSSRRERFAVASRLLGYLSSEEPFVLHFDDLHWSPKSRRFVEYLVDEETAPPVLVLATVGSDRPSSDLEEVEQLATTRIGLDELEPAEADELVERTLGPESGVADTVSEASIGRPLAIRELVREAQFEEAGDSALRSEPFAANDPVSLWSRRFERLDSDGRRALEVASVLGRTVDVEHWEAACRRVGVDVPDDVVAELVRLGIARRERYGWVFAHPTAVDAARSHAERADRLADIADACAEVVGGEEAPAGSGEDLRRARLLEVGERWEEGAEALMSAIDTAQSAGALEGLEELFERHEHTMERLDGEVRREHRVRHELARIHLAIDRSDFEGAGDRLDALFPDLRERGPSRSLVEALLLSAAWLERRGHLRAALKRTDEALEVADDLGDPNAEALAIRKKGVVKLWQAEWEDAIESFRRATERFGEAGDERELLKTQRWLMVPYTYRGDLEMVEKTAESLRERALEVGERWTAAQTSNRLGEVARYRGDWAEARRQYEAFRRASDRLGLYNERVGQLNLAMVDVGAGEFERAHERFSELVEMCEENDVGQLEPTVRLGYAAACAGLRDADAFRRAVEAAGRALERVESREYDQLWLAERIEAIGERNGWADEWVGSRFGVVVEGLREYFA